MRKFSHITLLFVLVGFISSAQAGLLIEPLVGYNINTKLDFDEPGGASYSGGMGMGYGGRLGYQNLGFQLGLDYLHSSIDMDDKELGENLDLDEWAAFVGFEFPVLLRIYAGYIFSATGETEGVVNDKLEFSKGSGMKAGVGFTGIPFIDINLEFRRGTFEEYDYLGSTTKEDTNYSAIMIGISAPFNI